MFLVPRRRRRRKEEEEEEYCIARTHSFVELAAQ
jgi:hypothetical protein